MNQLLGLSIILDDYLEVWATKCGLIDNSANYATFIIINKFTVYLRKKNRRH